MGTICRSIAINYFDKLIAKDCLRKSDLAFIIDKITVYEDHVKIKLKDDITAILEFCSDDTDALLSGNKRHGKNKTISAELEPSENKAETDKIEEFSLTTISASEPLSNISENLAFLLGFSIFLCNYKYFYDNSCVYKKRGFICSDPISLFFAPKKNPAQTIIFSAIRKHSKAIQFSRYTFT